VRCVDKEGVGVFSHQIPARLLTEEDAVAGLEGVACWELDPASLPPQLLRLGWERERSSLSKSLIWVSLKHEPNVCVFFGK
jgi:hypothetical protein